MKDRGQALVLFALFLFVMLGICALAIDYANWLLIDRRMQNVSDHASLAGASVFRETISGTDCREDPNTGDCQVAARIQAWTSLNHELELGLIDAQIVNLALRNSPAVGDVGDAGGGPPSAFTRRIWVSVPPPRNVNGHLEYRQVGGRLAGQQGVVFVRVDEPTRSYFAGVFGIEPGDRTGWATAGMLPNDFALEIFCRDGTDPSGSGRSCVSKGVGIEGQGGITIIRGDIGSNESLQVTANTGPGVILQDGNVFIANVADKCGPSTWNCPPATLGGITDGFGNPKDAFYTPPIPYLRFASPLDDVTVVTSNCSGASSPDHLCVPFAGNSLHDWTCNVTGFSNLCGVPVHSSGIIDCNAADPPSGYEPSPHLLPWSDGSGANGFSESPDQSNGEDWKVLDDDPEVPDPDTTASSNPPADFIYMNGTLGVNGGGATQKVTYSLRPPFGVPQPNLPTTVRYVAFKTDGTSTLSGTGNVISVSARLLQGGIAVPGGTEAPDAHTLAGIPGPFEFQVPAGQITDYTSLSIEFTFHTVSGDNSNKRGAGIAWAEAETPTLDPALPAMIGPGYYHKITVPDGGCAIMDPTGVYTGGLKAYQKPGIYRFGTGNDASISVGAGAFLVGDGVTLHFNPEFPSSSGSGGQTSAHGIVVGDNGGIVLNTSRVPGSPACSADTETMTYNPSDPLTPLPVASLCAAWAVSVSDSATIKPGIMTWVSSDGTTTTRGYCDPAVLTAGAPPNQCVRRDDYSPVTSYRGVTFFFATASWPPTGIQDRFQMSGSSGSEPGISFRGILYAPWDDVKLTGSNDFHDVGQVLAWTAKFAGQAAITLDYPYTKCEGEDACLPYLIEPTLNQ